MSQAGNHHAINYLELSSTDIETTRKFYTTVFGWSFTDYGPEYTSFDAHAAGISGGFYKAAPHDAPAKTAPLLVIYSKNLEDSQAAVVAAGGKVVVPTFEFPGGRRFHFADGAGNVLAVWSE